MCGIFGVGVAAGAQQTVEPALASRMLDFLFLASETRGHEAAGGAGLGQDAIHVYNSPQPASRMIRTASYRNTLQLGLATHGRAHLSPYVLMGHARLVTDGVQYVHTNNQPVIADGLVGIHNGFVVYLEEISRRFPDLERAYEVDSEVILRLLRRFYEETHSLERAVQLTYREIRGAASVAVMFDDLNA